MESSKLAVRKSKNSSALTARSQQSSRQMATEMLTMAMAKFGKELTPPEAKSWREILERQPSGAIEWAFKEYFRTPPNEGERKWFPEEWQIIQLLERWHREQYRLQKEAKEEAENRETELRRQRGETLGWDKIRVMFKETIAKIEARQFPEVTPDRRAQLQKQIASLQKQSHGEKST